MIKDNFEQFEVDNLIKAVELLCKQDTRDGDAKHLLQLLIDIKENGEVLAVVKETPND